MAKPTTRLSQKCTNKDCCKAFCRPVDDPELEKKILKVLSKYGDSLNCRKIMKGEFKIENASIWIDSMIYAYQSLNNSEAENSELSCFALKTSKMFKKISTSEKKDHYTTKNKTCRDIHHQFCSIMTKDLDDEQRYFLTGVLHFLLRKFQNLQDPNLAIIILRYFNILYGNDKSYSSLNFDCLNVSGVLSNVSKCNDKNYNRIEFKNTIRTHPSLSIEMYPVLVKAYEVFTDRVLGTSVSSPLTDHHICPTGECFFYFNLSISDFKKSVKVLKLLIDNNESVDFREDQKLVFLFKAFQTLFDVQYDMKVLSDADFVLNRFYSRINLKNELKFMKLKFDTPICPSYAFAMPLKIKADIIRIQNMDLMKVTLQEAFFRALFEGVTQPYLFISIRRDKIYQDTLKIIADIDDCDLKKQLKVKFKGEEGIDSGGIKKEFFLLLGHEIENDICLFTQTNNRIWFKNGANLNLIESIGKLVGIALYNDVVLNVPFPSMLFKKLLDQELEYDDLEEIEPEIFNSLKKLENCTVEELEFLDQNFTADWEINGQRTNCELFPGGRDIKVTKGNVRKFVMDYFRFLTNDVIGEEFNAFARGFHSIVNKEHLISLSATELEKIIIGCDQIDFEILRKNTIYNGFSASSPVIQYFWSYFSALKTQKKKKLIQFVTGNDRMPVGGSEALKLVIMRNGCDTDRLPSSQTCFNTLLLPEYCSAEKLEQKMNKAIEMAAGFFLM